MFFHYDEIGKCVLEGAVAVLWTTGIFPVMGKMVAN
jgi:hypothetical protein